MKKKKIIIIIIFMLIIFVIFSLYTSVNSLKENRYQMNISQQNISEDITLLFIADLHDHTFGLNNADLISEVNSQSPDLILMGGDMLNSYSENSDIVCDLLEQLSELAPVYYGLGNHELEYMESHAGLIEELTAAGAVVLDRDYIDTRINGEEVRIGGLYDYAFYLVGMDEASLEPDRLEVKHFLEEFVDTDALKIMISHRPDSFIFADAADSWEIDLVVSGHLHGGQVVLPVFGGVYGGDQGNFPEYVHGMYEKENIHLFVTSGLGTNKKIVPRFNNRPEIAVIEIDGE